MMDDEMIERLVRMETKLDLVLTRGADHETRLRALEERRWPLGVTGTVIGALGVICAFASVILAVYALMNG